MEDQGEKIVFLARELLNAGVPEKIPAKKTPHVTMTFKTLCFTTILAAVSGGLISTAVQAESRPLNRYEKVELQALVFYTARQKGVDEGTLRDEVVKHIGVDQFEDMTAHDFSEARHFLREKAL